jgi:energy-coupling factor transporter transmembrane protein EcfT
VVIPIRALRIAPVPAALALFGCAAAALLVREVWAAALLTGAMALVCLRAPRGRRRLYLAGVALSALGVLVLSPLLHSTGSHPLWTGPTVPVLGVLDVTREELSLAALNAFRLAAVGLAFAAYALLVDHDALVSAAGFARRSALAVALATRLVPTLERDAAGLAEAVRGRGVEVRGTRGHARLLSPLVAGSLERALTLAEAMEARGYGRPGATRARRPPWSALDHAAVGLAAVLVVASALWL